MSPLRIVVLDRAPQQRHMLLAHLSALGPNALCESQDAQAALQQCLAAPVDMVLCNLPGEIDACRALFRTLAAIPDTPALAFYGCYADIDYLESSCLQFGLCYLGFISRPFDARRLQRMLDQLRMYVQGRHP